MWIWMVIVALCLGVVLVALAWMGRGLRTEAARARHQFLREREHLEADFLHAASVSGKPRGLRWKNCDWERDVVLARDTKTGELSALVGVTIQFEAIPGSDMEGLPALSNLRNASGVFSYRHGRWRTGGRVVFNLNPAEAIEHFKGQYERIEAPADG